MRYLHRPPMLLKMHKYDTLCENDEIITCRRIVFSFLKIYSAIDFLYQDTFQKYSRFVKFWIHIHTVERVTTSGVLSKTTNGGRFLSM